MSITKRILDWTDKSTEKIFHDGKVTVTECAKAFGLGAIEGAIDAAVISIPIVIAKRIIGNLKK